MVIDGILVVCFFSNSNSISISELDTETFILSLFLKYLILLGKSISLKVTRFLSLKFLRLINAWMRTKSSD